MESDKEVVRHMIIDLCKETGTKIDNIARECNLNQNFVMALYMETMRVILINMASNEQKTEEET